MVKKFPAPPPGSWLRRFWQAVGVMYNDDGTWGPMRLESPRGREVMPAEREERLRRDRQKGRGATGQ